MEGMGIAIALAEVLDVIGGGLGGEGVCLGGCA